MEQEYNPQKIETSIQQNWETQRVFQVTEDTRKEKFYCLSMFPYPSGRLHMGHVRNYTIGDVVSRYQRMLGKNVLQPIGWDAFGLPAENAAIKHQVPPAEWTYANIAYMRKQFMRLGFAYDWSREITTCDPSYYRWEQWFFLRLLKKGLLYKKNAAVNWDPVDQTILANEQVVNGRGWRSGALVERREIPQWFLKITAYADALLEDLDKLEQWPQQVKTMQKNWIGKSSGVEINFPIQESPIQESTKQLTIFTTRPDTVYGVTYIAIAPQHFLAEKAATHDPAIQAFLNECRNMKVAEADMATMEKRGMPSGFYAIHPLTQAILPIWIANFVVMEYGSGAVMSVPAHDQRDYEFAKRYQLPIKTVIQPIDESTWDVSKGAFTTAGKLINSDQFTGLDSESAITAIIAYLEKAKLGQTKIHFRLRDWSISRQRYWGTPIPIIHCTTCGAVPVPDEDLPVILPENITFTGTLSPLKSDPTFYQTSCPTCQQPATRETDTFDTFMESSWYYLRFTCPKQSNHMLDDSANYWAPVDQYIGGIEHAVMHLLYARFFHKLLRDEGLVNSDEPFQRLLTQGMVLNNGTKMSKSKGNTVDPQPLIEHFGADTVRVFTMFAAPPEQSLEWSDSGVEGSHRFLKRLWSLGVEYHAIITEENQTNAASQTTDWDTVDTEQRAILRQLYDIVEQATFDYERLQLNTVVSGCMKLLNLLVKIPTAHPDKTDRRTYIITEGMSILLRLLAPIAPHITNQLWQDLHYQGSLLDAPWPTADRTALKATHIELVVQINGKLRGRVTVPEAANTTTIEELVKQDDKIKHILTTMTIKKIIDVPKKLVNIVTEAK